MSITVNKIAYDFYSLEFDLTLIGGPALGLVEGVEELEYTEKYNREKLRGTSPLPVDRTGGDVDPEGSITIQETWMAFILDSAAQAGIARRDLKFNLTINYHNKGEAVKTDTLVDCQFGEIGRSFSRGPSPLMVKCPLDVMNIFMNGVDPLGNKL